LYFIYSFDPLVILACHDTLVGECEVIYGENPMVTLGGYRGGTPAIETSNMVFEGFMHSTALDNTHSKEELPIPANKTSVVYYTHKFKLNLTSRPVLTIGPPISLFGKSLWF